MAEQKFPRRFGRYLLLDKVNAGGMAEVYRARISGGDNFQRVVAIKCMLPSLADDTEFTTMFIDEARLAAQLNHGNIVQIYELGRHEKQLYIAMELVQGHDLRATTKRARKMGKRLGVGFVAFIISKAAEALDYAHNKLSLDGTPLNLVHRDVSPQNILVSYDGQVKVVDFGIAKAEHRATETKAGTLKGKFAYMAPEQVVGDTTDRRADIFALGAVLYEGATGRPLFYGDTDLAILEKVRTAELPNLEEQLAHAPAQLAKVIRKACAKEPDERYQSALDMADDLSPVLISRGNLFGPKNARTTMRVLYSDEWQALPDKMKHYASIELPEEAPSPTRTQVLGALLHGTDEVPLLKDIAPPAAAVSSAKAEPVRAHESPAPAQAQPFVASSTELFNPKELAERHRGGVAPAPLDPDNSESTGPSAGPRTPFDPDAPDAKTEAFDLPPAAVRLRPEPSRNRPARDPSGRHSSRNPRPRSTGMMDELRRAPANLQYALYGLLGACVVIIVVLVVVLMSRRDVDSVGDPGGEVVPLDVTPAPPQEGSTPGEPSQDESAKAGEEDSPSVAD
ncbi:MAG: protein kinase, partial [Myxococcota bacterium]